MNFDDDSMSLDELRDIVSQGGKRAEPVHVNVGEEKFLKSLGNPGAIDTPLADYGRRGDTEIVYANRKEQELLKAQGGAGTINPETGLKEYPQFDEFFDDLLGTVLGVPKQIANVVSDAWGGLTGAVHQTWKSLTGTVHKTWEAFKDDPIREGLKLYLTYTMGPVSSIIPNTAITYSQLKDKGMSDSDALRRAGTGAAAQYATQQVVGSEWYGKNVGGAAAQLGIADKMTQAATQKIINGAASSAIASFVTAKLVNSQDPWGDMVRGGLAGGLTTGASLGLD